MSEKLTVQQWAEHIDKEVKHKLFGKVLLVGVRTECDFNTNIMLNIKVISSAGVHYYWVYDYETEIIETT